MTAATIKALKTYAKDLTDFDFAKLQAHIKDESDRAAVMILTARLEDALEQALRDRVEPAIGKTASDKLFAYSGALGTFSSRIDVAYAFGVIERETRNQLNNLREMRNACAHSQKSISFAVKELQDALVLFCQGTDSFYSHWSKTRKAKDDRTRLSIEVVMLGGAIETGSRAGAVQGWDKAIANAKAKTGDA